MHHLYWKFWGVDCQCSNSGCHVYWEDFCNWFSIFFFLNFFPVHDQIIHSKEIEREFIRCFKFNNTSLSSIGLFKENSGFGLCCMPRHSYMLYHFLVIWNISLHMHKNIAIMWGFSFRFCWVLCGTSACVCTLCRDSVLDFVGFYVEHLLACMHKSLAIMSGFSFCWVLYFTCWQNAQSI